MNNEAKYKAFIEGLRSAKKLLVPELYISSNSKLVVNQVTEKFKAHGSKMEKYVAVAKPLLKEFQAIEIK